MHVIGVDPGLSGGIAILEYEPITFQERRVVVFPLPTTAKYTGKGKEIDCIRLVKLLRNEIPRKDVSLIVLELVRHYPIGKKKGNAATENSESENKSRGATSMFSFGDGFGIVRSSLKLLYNDECNKLLQYQLPQAWQKRMFQHLPAGEKDTKKKALAYVTGRFPYVSLLATKRSKVAHDGMIDALCIADFAFLAIQSNQEICNGK